jgi:hypothetical protein
MKFFLLALLVSSSAYCIAQGTNPSGCIIVYPYGTVASYKNVYSTPLPSVSVPAGQAADILGKPVYDGQGVSFAVNLACYRDPVPNTTRECVVRAGTSSPYSWFGGVFAQNYYMCPIDDYIPYLMLLLTGLGFITLRNNRSVYFNIF